MKKHIRFTGPVLAVAATILVSLALAQNKTAAPKLAPQMEEMMKRAEAFCTPGPAHQILEPLVGDWNAEIRMWTTPNASPTISKGTAKNTWTLQGRFVQQDFSGEFAGKPFHGISFTGYDNVRQKYRSVWIDDMSTTMVTSEGIAADGGKIITLWGDYACAITGERHRQTTQIYRIISRDKHVVEMHDPAKTNNSKEMEIAYTRK